STNPADGALGVAVISASFSEPMNASTITAASFSLTGPLATAITGTVTYDAAADVARCSPTNPLAAGASYTATVSTQAKDLAGNGLALPHSWTFTTQSSSSNEGTVTLGAAGGFAVLAGSTVTNVG